MRRLSYDPIGALHMLRMKKQEEIKKIDLVLACYGMERETAHKVPKEERN
jgi:hypothetical protein